MRSRRTSRLTPPLGHRPQHTQLGNLDRRRSGRIERTRGLRPETHRLCLSLRQVVMRRAVHGSPLWCGRLTAHVYLQVKSPHRSGKLEHLSGSPPQRNIDHRQFPMDPSFLKFFAFLGRCIRRARRVHSVKLHESRPPPDACRERFSPCRRRMTPRSQ